MLFVRVSSEMFCLKVQRDKDYRAVSFHLMVGCTVAHIATQHQQVAAPQFQQSIHLCISVAHVNVSVRPAT